MRARKARRLTQRELRALGTVGLTVVKYQPDGERAEIRQLSPESDQRRRSFARRLADDREASEEA